MCCWSKPAARRAGATDSVPPFHSESPLVVNAAATALASVKSWAAPVCRIDAPDEWDLAVVLSCARTTPVQASPEREPTSIFSAEPLSGSTTTQKLVVGNPVPPPVLNENVVSPVPIEPANVDVVGAPPM